MPVWPLQLLDGAIVVAALASAWLWWRASAQRLRRVSRHEQLDAADINRMVTALNRMQIFGARAAMATAIASALAGLRLILSA